MAGPKKSSEALELASVAGQYLVRPCPNSLQYFFHLDT